MGNVSCHEADDGLVIVLEGRIDTNNSMEVESEIFKLISERGGEVASIDAGKLAYISSAGLRVLMKLRKNLDKKLVITDVSPEVYDIFDSTGFTELFEVQKRMREVSVEGCELLGSGGNGAVYKLDAETIVKVYYGERNSLEKIKQNRAVTKDVFLHGVPTTIAFDIVRVGENYGVVFEMIDAKSMMQEMVAHPEKLDEYANMIADTLIKMHHTEFEEGTLPDSRDRARSDLKAISDRGYLKPQEEERIRRLIDDIPMKNTFIHQDFHPGNMMLQKGEIVLIDVEDAGLGHPVLDLSSMYLVYVTAAKRSWKKNQQFLGKKEYARVWDIIIRKYFNTDDPKELARINRILEGYSMIKFLRGVATSPSVKDFLRKPVIFFTKRKLFKMIDELHPIP